MKKTTNTTPSKEVSPDTSANRASDIAAISPTNATHTYRQKFFRVETDEKLQIVLTK
jgi:hypothetical protein